MREVILGQDTPAYEVPIAQETIVDLRLGASGAAVPMFTVAGAEAANAAYGGSWGRSLVVDPGRCVPELDAGYKGLRTNETVSLGSSPEAQASLSGRFPWLHSNSHLAPNHVSLTLGEAGRVTICHLAAGQITRLMVSQPENGFPVSQNKLEDDLESLMAARNRVPVLRSGFDTLQQQQLASQLYVDWYSKSNFIQQDVPTQEQYKKMFGDRYALEGWYRMGPDSGDKLRSPYGRLYANIAVPELPRIAGLLEERMPQKGAHFKVNADAQNAATRPDNFVLYFRPQNARRMVQALAELQIDNPDAFLPETPPLTAAVKTKDGAVVPGVGFGQHPEGGTVRPGLSFGQSRCQMAAEMLLKGSLRTNDIRHNLAKPYTARKYNIHPAIPALNADTGHLFRHFIA